jgi:hypothetical protein
LILLRLYDAHSSRYPVDRQGKRKNHAFYSFSLGDDPERLRVPVFVIHQHIRDA